MGDYFAHWLRTGEREGAVLPRIFYVNWFRKSDDGRWLWPGFGENSRVLKWVFGRCAGTSEAAESPLGLAPAPGALDVEGLGMADEDLEELFSVDPELWTRELDSIREHLAVFGDRLPPELWRQADLLEKRLKLQDVPPEG
jgi:phosphoenolpyruvate carboxykinase (GTP)